MLKLWQGGSAAAVVTAGTITLVILDQTDRGFRFWWLTHALTTDTVAGVLVVLLTVLVVDQVIRTRQIKDRARAISAQAAMLTAQASRSVQAVSGMVADSGDREAATDAFRTYMMMLLVSTPVLIDVKISRNFLEEAQRLGAEMAYLLGDRSRAPGASAPPGDRLDAAERRLKDASTPLLAQLTPEERTAVTGGAAS